MRWATRAGCKVDRAACAWLIRRFIDPAAEFVFVHDPSEVPADATPFEIPGAELAHHDGDCTFEVMIGRYGLTEPGLWAIARIVHEADIGDERYAAPEALGLAAVILGIAAAGDDEHTLAAAGPIFDGLLRLASRTDGFATRP
jgi:hypothetical protein